MQQQASNIQRLSVIGVTVALLMAWLAVSSAPPADASGYSGPPPIPAVSAGGYFTCGLDEGGTAVCWGQDEAPGDGNTAPGMATPPTDVQFQMIKAGYGTGCGVTTDNEVVCWGNDRFGKVTQVPEGEYSHVTLHLNYVCALRTDGSIACWGGDDGAAPGGDPDQLVLADMPTEGEYTRLGLGNRHACALDTDNIAVCWGYNADGQIDVPDTEDTYIAVDAGNFDSCALRAEDGTAVCWGRNAFGQQNVAAGAFTDISVGFGHVCALREDGTIACWGRNAETQSVPPAGTFTHVSAGTFHSCAMPTAGPPAICWGNNQGGRVAPGMNPDDPFPQAVVDEPYTYQFTMDTHVAPAPAFTVVDGALPPGLDLSPDGELSGTPTQAGTYTVTLAASSLGISPPDCPLGAPSSTLPCEAGNLNSVAIATRVFAIEVLAEAEDAGAITGQVTDVDSGDPIAGAGITVVHSGGAQAGDATTDGDGNYTVADLPPGTYSVTADHAGYEAATQQDVTVTEGAATTVDIALQAHPPLTIVSVWNNLFDGVTDGLFVDWSERINAQFATAQGFTRYTIHEQAGCVDDAIATGEAGFWTGGRPTTRDVVFDGWENVTEGGTYHLRVLADTESAFATGVRNTEVCVEFVALLHPDDRPEPGAIDGVVTATDGAAIIGATVTVTDAGGATVGSATTDTSGAYAVGDLAPGSYTVTAEADGFEPASEADVIVTEATTTTVDFALEPVAPADPQTRDDCMGTGWQEHGFRNQGQCIRFVQTGMDARA